MFFSSAQRLDSTRVDADDVIPLAVKHLLFRQQCTSSNSKSSLTVPNGFVSLSRERQNRCRESRVCGFLPAKKMVALRTHSHWDNDVWWSSLCMSLTLLGPTVSSIKAEAALRNSITRSPWGATPSASSTRRKATGHHHSGTYSTMFRQRSTKKLVKARPVNTVRLKGRVTAIVALRGGENVVTACWGNTLRIFRSASGECLHVLKGHDKVVRGKVADVAQLDEDTLVSVSDDKTARVWRVSDGTLLETVSLGDRASSVASLGGGHFIVGLGSGALREFKWNGTSPVVVGEQVDSSGGAHVRGIEAISVHGNRFATASWNKKAKVWEWDAATATFGCVATLEDHKKAVGSVSLSDSYIVTGSEDRSMCVYDAKSFQLQRRIKADGLVNGVALTGNEQRCVSVTDSGTINVHDVSTGALLWKWKTEDGLLCCTVLPEGRIAFGGYIGYSVLVTPPTHIADQIRPTPTQLVDFSTTAPCSLLQTALESVQSGQSSAAHECRVLITAENCSVSLPEWSSAHKLLMLAVSSGDIPPTTAFEAKRNWWFLELYSLAKHFAAPDNLDDFREMQRCLDEAKLSGVIETTEAALGDAVLAQQFQDEIRALHRAGIMICQRLLQIEESVHDLDESFTRYKKVERTTKLVGIALQLIPIAGGAAAGVLSAGAEIFDGCGLSVKDVTDYALGLVQVSDEDVMSFTGRLFGNACKSIAPETLSKLDENKKHELVEIVISSGYSIETLRTLFQDPSREVEATATVVLLEESSNPDNSSAVGDVHLSGNSNQEETKPFEQECEAQEGTLNVLTTKRDCREESKRLEFKSSKLSRKLIGSSTPEDIARLWAAFILRSDEDTAEFRAYFTCVWDVLSENDICGALLVVQDTFGEHAVSEMGEKVMAELEENEQVTFTFGKQIWAKRFIKEVYTVCHGECSSS